MARCLVPYATIWRHIYEIWRPPHVATSLGQMDSRRAYANLSRDHVSFKELSGNQQSVANHK